MKKKRWTVAEARAKLYDLVEYVTETPDSAVVIEHRDRKERAVLVDEGHYKYLETVVYEMKKRDEKPFKLAGSILTPEGVAELDVEEMIAEVRRNDEIALQKKLDEIFADD